MNRRERYEQREFRYLTIRSSRRYKFVHEHRVISRHANSRRVGN
jgi:hypothetical protein